MRTFLLCLLWLPALAGAHPLSAAEPTQQITFERDIRPIFRAHCFDCHGATDELEGSLDLRLVRFMLRGGDSGPAIVAQDPQHSLLLERVRAGEMPPGESRLSDEELATLTAWIGQGAPTLRPEPETIGPGLGVTEEERQYWAFQPLDTTPLPPAESPRERTGIDTLLQAAMPAGVSFSPDAARSTLVMRAYLDLIGLPPTYEQLQRWTTAPEAGWYEQLIDELLDSKHYGERWARHWLDVAGYADSEGYSTADQPRAWAWKYRDWVVRALNDDLPYDQFVMQQLAGDELAGPRQGDWTDEQVRLLTATGFLRMAADGTGSGGNNVEGRNQVVADTLKIVSGALLGLSVQCAQCHDHRYDPIPQTDYYALRAVFEPALNPKAWKTPPQRLVSLYTQADREAAQAIEAQAAEVLKRRAERQQKLMSQALQAELKKYEEPLRSQLREAYRTSAKERSPGQRQLLDKHPSVNITTGNLYQYIPSSRPELKKLADEAAAIRAKKPPEQFLRVLAEPAAPPPTTFLFHRGDPQQPQQPIEPGGLTVTAPPHQRATFPADAPSQSTSGRRLAFARWLTNGRHPLTPRVIANRVWMHHFGAGLVKTPADFGRLGSGPSHLRLLDHLAASLIEDGWSLKALHRRIMLSTAYRQAGEGPQAAGPPSVYACKPLLRLEAETIRDRILHVSGSLSDEMAGPPAPAKMDDVGQVVVEDTSRRSLYVQVRRSQPVAMLQAFDAPVMETNCERREVSTVATQSLMLMNSPLLLAQARRVADRAAAEAVQAGGSPLLTPETLAKLPEAPPSVPVWEFGYGSWDAEQQRTRFTPLPHWTGSQWQGGAELPAAEIGWTLLHADGGHPGGDDGAAIRRWVAPRDGLVSIAGKLAHGSENGNGVRGFIIGPDGTAQGDFDVFHGETETAVAEIQVERGQTIDFLVDRKGSETSDSFQWAVDLTLKTDDGTEQFSSAAGFHGPRPSVDDAKAAVPAQLVRAWQLVLGRDPSFDELRLACEAVAEQTAKLTSFQRQGGELPDGMGPRQQAVANICQALLGSNEFLYVD